MTALLRTPARRIAFAVALSVLLHAAILGLPQFSLPREAVLLPPLTAKLIIIPKQTQQAAPAQPRHPALPRPKPKPRPHPPQPVPPPAMSPSTPPNPQVTGNPGGLPASTQAVPPASAIDGTTAAVEKPDVSPLPKQALLVFAAYRGNDNLYVGDMRHELETGDGHYSIRAYTRTVGLARLFKSYDLTQTSRGILTRAGDLLPERYTEEKTDEHGTQEFSSDFNWTTHRATFSNGTSEALPENSQDFLSFLYQLSQTFLDKGAVPVEISNGKKLERYQLEVKGEEDIVTPMGKQPAIHLSKLHAPGEEGLDIWLALKYRLLPIKFRQIGRDGNIAGELAIKEIRVSDE